MPDIYVEENLKDSVKKSVEPIVKNTKDLKDKKIGLKEYIKNDIKNTKDDINTKVLPSIKKNMATANDKVNKVIDKTVNIAAKPGSKVAALISDSAYNKYQNSMLKAKQALKALVTAGTVAAIEISPIPFTTPISVIIASIPGESGNDIDKLAARAGKQITSLLDKIKENIKNVCTKVKNKELSIPNAIKFIKKEFIKSEKIVQQARHNNVPANSNINESVEYLYEKIDSFIGKVGNIPMATYDAVWRFAESADYTSERDIAILDRCIELFEKDC